MDTKHEGNRAYLKTKYMVYIPAQSKVSKGSLNCREKGLMDDFLGGNFALMVI